MTASRAFPTEAPVRPDSDGTPQRLSRSGMLVVVALMAIAAPILFLSPFSTTDEALLVVYAEQFMNGRLPGGDFFTVYGPGGFATIAAAFQVFGVSVAVERTVGLAYRLALVAGVMFLTSRYGAKASWVSGLTSLALVLSSGLTAFAWFGGLALSVWSIGILMQSNRGWSAFAAGILGGLASAWRLEMIVMNAAAVPLFWRNRRAAPFLGGVVIGTLPTILWLVAAGRVAFDNVVLNRMAINAQLELSQVPLVTWVLLGFACTVTAATLLHAARSRNRNLLTLGLLGLLVLPQAMQRIDGVHTMFVLCIIFPISIAYASFLGWLSPAVEKTSSQRATGRTVVVLLLLSMAFAMAMALHGASPARVTYAGRTIPVEDSQRRNLISLLAAISEHVPPGSKIFVGAVDMSVPTLSDVRLYHLLHEYRAPWFYLELPPGVAELRGSPLADDVSAADALILSDVPEELRRSLFPYIPAGSDSVNRIVARDFCLVDQFGRTRLYVRCSERTAD